MEVIPFPLEAVVARVRARDGLVYSRYGDGTILCLWGPGQSGGGVVYTPEAAAATQQAILDTRLTHCMTQMAIRNGRVEEWLEQAGIDIPWYDGDVIFNASLAGELRPFIDCLREERVIVVGPAHLRALDAFPVAGFVETHPTQAFEQANELEARVRELAQATEATLVSLSVGCAAAPAMCSRLADTGLTVLDIGSTWDPYVGVFSRRSYRKAGDKGFAKLARLNLGAA